jgi:hypothetical protein
MGLAIMIVKDGTVVGVTGHHQGVHYAFHHNVTGRHVGVARPLTIY